MSTVLDQGNRTFIGSVVFVDIVGYSKTSVSEQLVLKDRFTALLAEAIKDIALEQRIILDTGDGAAMSFLGDPEDALFVSMHMRDFLQRTYADLGLPEDAAQEDIDIGPQGDLSVRIGINLGPVKLLRDINGHPNIVGDGINVAQRIMTFARPGQIVVSRSYFDVVSVISEEYAKLFKYEGSRTDKHVREHEIYIVGESAAAFDHARAGLADRAAATNPKAIWPDQPAESTGAYSPAAVSDDIPGEDSIPFWRDREKLTIAGWVLGALVISLIVAAWVKKPAETPRTDLAATPVAVRVLPPAAAPTVSPAVTPPTTITTPPTVAKTDDASSTPAPVATTMGKTVRPVPPVADAPKATADTAKGAKMLPAKDAEAAKIQPTKPGPQGTVRLSIDPWGEVFVNGRAIGVSPPMKQYPLAPGKYKIEVKNGTFTPYVTTIEVKAKEDVAVKYRFQ